MRNLTTLVLACAAGAVHAGPANPSLPLDRPFTQRNPEPRLLEAEHARLATGTGPLSFVFPRPCVSPLDESAVRGEPYRLAWRDSAGDRDIGFAPIAGAEYRYERDKVAAAEAGGLLVGHKGPASFFLDARIFTENAGRNWVSYDGEAVDVQDEDVTGTSSYLSYARYRGELALDLPVGRLSASRDAAHWGPALLGALTFNQQGIPFNQFAFTTHLGPVTVHSLYGDLRTGGAETRAPENPLYAHRYELRLGRNLLLGMSEQLILTGSAKPYLFVPVFPLFIAKGFMHEDGNNGNLAFDAAFRLPGVGLLYGEFLLDDLESPASLLLEDYSQNKWAVVAGVHGTRALGTGLVGLVAEATRIEPWVYTHFQDHPAPAANLGVPLGNPLGPNTLDLRARTYFRRGAFHGAGEGAETGLYLGATVAATWKGTGPGSSATDTTYVAATHLEPKRFLEGADGPDWSLEPYAAFGWRTLSWEAAWTLADRPRGYVRVLARY